MPAAGKARAHAGLVGRERELELVLAAVDAGRDVLLEGPPGTSKSTILRGITAAWDVPFVLVEGNAELTPAKLVGHHNPARVLAEDYSAGNFVPGPLIEAMRAGGFLYIEELNRAPEDTLNVLLAAMAERQLSLPRVGLITALPTFRVMASMNPFDNVGTARVSASVYDRWCRLAVGYQSAEEERGIVRLRSGSEDHRVIKHAVAMTRASRRHPELRRGSSVRGAIDLACITEALLGMEHAGGDYGTCLLDAACLALSARVAVDETSRRTPEAIIKELWEDVFILAEHRAAPGPYRIAVDNAVALPVEAEAVKLPGLAPLARKPKALAGAPTLYQPGGSAPVVIQIETVGRGAAGDLAAIAGLEKAQGSIITNETAQMCPLDDVLDPTLRSTVDPEVRRMAERIARRLSIRHRPRDRNATRGFGNLESVPYRYGSDDIDLDRTIEILAERPVPEDTDIIVRERVGSRRAVALLVDVSGSMRGEKVKIVAATVAALAADLVDDELALVAFWKDAALLKPLHGVKSAERMLEELTRIPAKGLTNVHFALSVGLAELGRSPARQRICVLLSDSVHNAGPDPRLLAPRFSRLHVLLQTDGEHDAALAAELARLGHGILAPVSDHRQVAPAVNRIMSA